ncbi:DUF2894 domain-containing protein [Lysobacter korlensis]|uniref:DUF2894 domain-containing protein n=1 Tax=Lysobacter korlensis TaxID=553636 RepID=A0ABV6RIJ0_9GAMM
MSDSVPDIHATLDAWRQQGANRMDPVRFHHIDALARRAASQRGGVRCLLDARLAELVGAYAVDLAAYCGVGECECECECEDGHGHGHGDGDGDGDIDIGIGAGSTGTDSYDLAASSHRRSALSDLLEHISSHPVARDAGALHPRDASASIDASTAAAVSSLEDVRRLCTEARSHSQLRQALEEAPENAGPLNSASLVHRALTLLSDESPQYLQPFMAYVDTLAWLAGMAVHETQAAKATSSTTGSGKRPRPKPRSRRA